MSQLQHNLPTLCHVGENRIDLRFPPFPRARNFLTVIGELKGTLPLPRHFKYLMNAKPTQGRQIRALSASFV